MTQNLNSARRERDKSLDSPQEQSSVVHSEQSESQKEKILQRNSSPITFGTSSNQKEKETNFLPSYRIPTSSSFLGNNSTQQENSSSNEEAKVFHWFIDLTKELYRE